MRNHAEIRNRKRLPVMPCALALLLILGTTSAYMTYRQSRHNRFTVGTNTIAVAEDYAPPVEMKAGENRYRKQVQAVNTGTVPCYVRMFVGFSDGDVEACSRMSADGSLYYPIMEYIDHLPDGWVYLSREEDSLNGGYYYYTEAVEPKQVTAPLFTMVSTWFEGEADVTDYEIYIYAESVQVKNLDGEEFTGGDSWKQAWTQFLERRQTGEQNQGKEQADAGILGRHSGMAVRTSHQLLCGNLCRLSGWLACEVSVGRSEPGI